MDELFGTRNLILDYRVRVERLIRLLGAEKKATVAPGVDDLMGRILSGLDGALITLRTATTEELAEVIGDVTGEVFEPKTLDDWHVGLAQLLVGYVGDFF